MRIVSKKRTRFLDQITRSELFIIPKKLSSGYQPDACGNFFRIPRFEKKLVFSDSLIEDQTMYFHRAGINSQKLKLPLCSIITRSV